MMKKLLVLVGPTGVGKTELSLQIAEHYSCPILSVDSRQLYKNIEIGTAAPTEEQKNRVPHYFVGILELKDYYSASDYEDAAIKKLAELFKENDIIVATGGSMMYIDALCYGMDPMPTIDLELRAHLYKQYEEKGLANLLAHLKLLDPQHYEIVDKKNHKRVIHALEICIMADKPYSSFKTQSRKKRPFEIIKVGIERNREELYNRINTRVDNMIRNGLLAEAEKYYPLRDYNSLNTVGYKELFKYLDGEWEQKFAIEKIKQHTRIYSRQQLRWFKKDENTHWYNLSNMDEQTVKYEIINRLKSHT